MLEIAKRQIIPSCIRYSGTLAHSVHELNACGINPQRMQTHLESVSCSVEAAMERTGELEEILQQSTQISDLYCRAQYLSEQVCGAMARLRTVCDSLETVVDQKEWPMPTYTDLLHRI